MSKEKKGKAVDAGCRDLTASWVRQRAQQNPNENIELCDYFEARAAPHSAHKRDPRLTRDNSLSLPISAQGFMSTGRTALLPPGVYTIDDLRAACEERTWCPYFVARYMVRHRHTAGDSSGVTLLTGSVAGTIGCAPW